MQSETVIKAALALTKIGRKDLAKRMFKVLAKDPWKDLPKGWTEKSLKKFWKSIGGDVDKCIKKMEGKVKDPGAFCSSLKDVISKTTYWREGRGD